MHPGRNGSVVIEYGDHLRIAGLLPSGFLTEVITGYPNKFSAGTSFELSSPHVEYVIGGLLSRANTDLPEDPHTGIAYDLRLKSLIGMNALDSAVELLRGTER